MLEANLQNCLNKTIVMRHTILASHFPFHAVTTGHVTAHHGFYTKRTERQDFFLVYTLSGSGKMTWHDETVDLLPHSVCLIDCKDYQYYRTTSLNEPWIHYYVHFDGRGIYAYAPYLLDKLRALYPVDESVFTTHFETFQKNELRNDALSLSIMNLMITEMINALMISRFDLSTPQFSEQYNSILPAYEFIRHQYKEEITIDKLCTLCNMSKYYFLHTFKEAIGESPYQYLSRHRIDCAKQLLITTTDSIENIAHESGFINYSNFIIQFKKITGVTPSEYRNATSSRSRALGEQNVLFIR